MDRTDSRIDLNLFRVLDAIYANGGVSAAARVLHLTQPAVTHALRRLREHLGDPLFVRQGNRLLPTDKVRAMMPAIQAHLEGLHASLHLQASFDPARLEMSFVVGLRDMLESIALPTLAQRLAAQAPRVTLLSRRIGADDMERELRAGSASLVIDRPLPASAQVMRRVLAEETLMVAMRADHPLAIGMLRSDYLAAQHVAVSSTGSSGGLDALLAQGGRPRRVRLICQHYFAACQVAAESDLLLTLPRSYALQMATLLPIALQPLPLRLKAIPIMAYWHTSTQDDPAHAWLRERVAESVRAAMQETG